MRFSIECLHIGVPRKSPYTAAGLTGRGQLVGVADSGLNELSCFFTDDQSGRDVSPLLIRDGRVDMGRRKVVQYISYADSFDEEGDSLFTHVVPYSQMICNFNHLGRRARYTCVWFYYWLIQGATSRSRIEPNGWHGT